MSPADQDPDSARRNRNLVWAGYLFAVGSAVHVLDHLRRGQGAVSDQINGAGTLALVLQAVVVTLILTRHRLAPLVATAAGFALAVGFGVVHWVPERSDLTDPLYDIGSGYSYIASTLEIAGALAIGVTGLAIVRADGLDSFAQHHSEAR